MVMNRKNSTRLAKTRVSSRYLIETEFLKNNNFFFYINGLSGSSLLTLKQLINHGIADELIEKMKIDTQEFFKFPLEEKMAYAQLPNEIEGYGQTLKNL
ncbi:hypothetical protein ERO13_D12G212750v2 [Gossypium hirsutum]|nr:hypothetical protein ERO13_D12G212750v2 [Gossypium hirsutum]